MNLNILQLSVSNSKCNFSIFNFEFKSRKIELNLRVSNSKCNFLFFDFELVTRSVIFYFPFDFELVTRSVIFYFPFELVTRSVTSFCITRFRNSRIPNLTWNELKIIKTNFSIYWTWTRSSHNNTWKVKNMRVYGFLLTRILPCKDRS